MIIYPGESAQRPEAEGSVGCSGEYGGGGVSIRVGGDGSVGGESGGGASGCCGLWHRHGHDSEEEHDELDSLLLCRRAIKLAAPIACVTPLTAVTPYPPIAAL